MKDENTTILVNTKVRILQYLEYKGISKPQFYADVEIKRGLLDSDKMNSTVTDTVVAKILVAYKDIAPMWLLTGEGPMLRTDGTPTMSSIPSTDTSALSDTVVLRLMDKIDEKDYIIKEKEAENKQLQSELRQQSAELAALKAKYHESQYKEPEPIIGLTDSFTDKSSGDYGEGFMPTKKSPSKKSSAGKAL